MADDSSSSHDDDLDIPFPPSEVQDGEPLEHLLTELTEFVKLGRGGKYGERRPPQLPNHPKWWYCTMVGELTPARLARHLGRRPHLGVDLIPEPAATSPTS